MIAPSRKQLNITLLVASLGYFVDIYDLQLFNIVSRESLIGMGISDPSVLKSNDYILFLWQMGGMLAGGIFWGILGDKRGRKSILFGSILLYSIANILNAFVVTIDQYAAVRFIAGLGLAGELGAAITLVSEIMHREKRGYGTMLIVTMGALGAVAAVLVNKIHWQMGSLHNWQLSYLIGGVLGILLLLLRMGTFESGMFESLRDSKVQRGNFILVLSNKKRLIKYIASILVGLPVWYCIGILIKFSDKFSISGQVIDGPVEVPYALMYAYIGLSVGDLFSGLFSQLFKNRKKVVLGYLLSTALLMVIFLYSKGLSLVSFYVLCFLVGAATGYWALFVTMASEQFGTNVRASVTTTVPNFVRGAVIPITLGFVALERNSNNTSAALITGIVSVGLAVLALLILPETFGKDLDYIEKN